jgi:hypothetical protein
MALHLIKLCVGCDSVAELAAWIEERLRDKTRRGLAREHVHTTRMTPKRTEELLDGGSLFWVIRGELACRQRLTDLRQVVDGNGIGRCELVLDPTLCVVRSRPVRPFQGWRYLIHADAPPDLAASGRDLPTMPESMRRELSALGLL